MPDDATRTDRSLSPLISSLRCLACRGQLVVSELAAASGYPDLGPDGRLRCQACSQEYPIIGGTPRMLESTALSQLLHEYPRSSHVLRGRAVDQGHLPPDPQAVGQEADGRQLRLRVEPLRPAAKRMGPQFQGLSAAAQPGAAAGTNNHRRRRGLWASQPAGVLPRGTGGGGRPRPVH